MRRFRVVLPIFVATVVLLGVTYLVFSDTSAGQYLETTDVTVTLTPVDPPEVTNTPTATPAARSYLSPVMKSTFAPSPTVQATITPAPTMTELPPP